MKEMNGHTRVFHAYRGREPYLFVSYAHADIGEICPFFESMEKNRYRFWYDEGIESGKDWADVISGRITNCSQFIVFISKNSANSDNVKNEINLALSRKKEIIRIQLDDTELRDGLELAIGSKQALNCSKYSAEETQRMFCAALRPDTVSSGSDICYTTVEMSEKRGKKKPSGAIKGILAAVAAVLVIAGVVVFLRVKKADQNKVASLLYEKGIALMETGDYAGAASAFEGAGTYDGAGDKLAEARAKQEQQENYEQGVALLENGDYEGAIAALEKAGTYEDAADYLALAKAEAASTEIGNAAGDKSQDQGALQVGESVLLGSYEQDGDASNGAEPIEWIVLEDKGDGEYLLIAKYGIEAKAYNVEWTSVTWETCSLRAWLNGEFYDTAFTENEKKLIAQTTVKNDDNPMYGTEGGIYTRDYVYLLSIDEVNRYFANDNARVCYPTSHAKESGAGTNSAGAGVWWLRSPGNDGYDAAGMYYNGSVDDYGYFVGSTDVCARPVVVVRLTENGTIASSEVSETASTEIGNAAGDKSQDQGALQVGESVLLGSYEQDGDASNGAEPIEWIVLEDKGDGEYVLISKYCLEAKAYNEEYTDVTWETCSLRAWLNGEFYETAFTENEKKLIALTDVKNDDNPEYGTEGGNDTQDYVYLLSIDEVNRYFADNDARVCYPTSHAEESGAGTNSAGAGAWVLRSPGYYSRNAARVRYDGNVVVLGDHVTYASVCARPVVAVRLTENGTIASSEVSETASTEIGNAAGDKSQDQGALQVGESVLLGSYEQDGDASNGAEPIEWIVLEDKGDGEYVLISKYGLEAKAYNEEDTSVTWETCSLRAWLNGEFYETAFTENEKKLIAQTTVRNDDNPAWGTEGGNDTQDYVYLLSLDELYTYFGSNEERVSVATAHATESGTYTLTQEDVTNYQSYYDYPLTVGAGFWWLRSPGGISNNAACGNYDGSVGGYGSFVYYTDVCARPVVAVRLTENGTIASSEVSETASTEIGNAAGDKSQDQGALQVGESVLLGSYEQDGDASNGAEPIEWIVLEDKGDGEYVLISKYCLESKAYNEEYTDVTWETCSLRKWLNGEFYETAFTENEKKLIALTDVKNDDNPEYGTEGGNDTQDYVYLLSIDEANRYFADNDARVCYPTSHAEESGAYTNSDTGAGVWWLRSPGHGSSSAARVRSDGYVSYFGYDVHGTDVCARPVVAVRLSNF